MGIARALERVKRARQEGLQGVITGLGRELRSEHVPSPLRAAAQRIAALLPVERSARTGGEGGKSPGTMSHAASVAVATERAPESVAFGVEPATGVHSTVAASAPIDDDTGRPRDGVSDTGSDDGVEPGPEEPEVGTPVDPESVGATPEVIASVTQVEPVDASPVDVQSIASTDASPVEVAPVAANPIVSQLVPDDVPSEPAPREPEAAVAVGSTVADEKTEEELAPGGEAAKNLARSTSRSKKRSRSKGTTSKKK